MLSKNHSVRSNLDKFCVIQPTIVVETCEVIAELNFGCFGNDDFDEAYSGFFESACLGSWIAESDLYDAVPGNRECIFAFLLRRRRQSSAASPDDYSIRQHVRTLEIELEG